MTNDQVVELAAVRDAKLTYANLALVLLNKDAGVVAAQNLAGCAFNLNVGANPAADMITCRFNGQVQVSPPPSAMQLDGI
jgi:hypothetical protein